MLPPVRAHACECPGGRVRALCACVRPPCVRACVRAYVRARARASQDTPAQREADVVASEVCGSASGRRAFLASQPTLPALSGACLCWPRTNGGRFTRAGLMKALETSTDVEPKPTGPVSGS